MRSFDCEANLVSRVECERTESPKRNFSLSPLSLSVPGTFANCDTNEARRHRSPPPLSSVRTLTFNISKTTRPFRNGIRDIEIKIKFGWYLKRFEGWVQRIVKVDVPLVKDRCDLGRILSAGERRYVNRCKSNRRVSFLYIYIYTLQIRLRNPRDRDYRPPPLTYTLYILPFISTVVSFIDQTWYFRDLNPEKNGQKISIFFVQRSFNAY